MLKRLALIGATAAAIALTFVACGDEAASGVNCTSTSDCRTGEICHPDAKQCVQTCSLGADCPDSAKNCAPISATDSTKICQCTTDQLCAGGSSTGSSVICSTEFHICMTKCGSNSDCPAGTSCDTSSGQCLRTGGSCNPSATSLGANGGPDACNYGDFCSSGGTCAAASIGTCSEATASGAPTWDKSAKQAPVITSASAVALATTNASTQCQNGDPAAAVTIQYYAPNGLTNHTTFSDLQMHVFFRTGTSFFGANFPVQDPPVSATFGQLKVGIACGQASGTAAIYLQDEQDRTSNVVCVSW